MNNRIKNFLTHFSQSKKKNKRNKKYLAHTQTININHHFLIWGRKKRIRLILQQKTGVPIIKFSRFRSMLDRYNESNEIFIQLISVIYEFNEER